MLDYASADQGTRYEGEDYRPGVQRNSWALGGCFECYVGFVFIGSHFVSLLKFVCIRPYQALDQALDQARGVGCGNGFVQRGPGLRADFLCVLRGYEADD